MIELIHMTATYSNAMLVAILPHISSFTKQLDLPVLQPVTATQVIRFNLSPYKDLVGAGVGLTNQYWFVFEHGCVGMFHSPDDWYFRACSDRGGVIRFLQR